MFSCCDGLVFFFLSGTRIFCLRGPDSKSPLLSKNCSRDRCGQTGNENDKECYAWVFQARPRHVVTSLDSPLGWGIKGTEVLLWL